MMRTIALVFAASLMIGCGDDPIDGEVDGPPGTGPHDTGTSTPDDSSTAPDSTVPADTGTPPDTGSTPTEAAVDGGADGGCVATTDAIMAKVADALCKPFDDCCKKAGLANDVTKCQANIAAGLQVVIEKAVCGGAVLDATKMEACENALTKYGQTCRDDANAIATGRILGICARAIDGTHASGDMCDHPSDCAQPSGTGYARCDVVGDAGTNECQNVVLGGADAGCDPPGVHPAVSHQCDYDLDIQCDGSKCVPKKLAGQSCATIACEYGLVCNDAKICATPAPDGAACSGTTPCGRDSVCDGGMCRHLALIGEACTKAEDCVPGAKGCVGGKCTPANYYLGYFGPGDTCTP